MSRNDTDDVLDFINSLPESKRGTPKPTPASDTGDDLLDFLDELSAHEKAAKPTGSSRGKFEPKKKDTEAREKPESAVEGDSSTASPGPSANSTASTIPPPSATSGASSGGPTEIGDPEKAALAQSLEANDQIAAAAESGEPADPLASISSWWNNEGSSKVSSLWGSLTSNAHQIGETTFQIASNTSQHLSHQRHKFISEHAPSDSEQHLGHITNRLNLILSTMSQQIKDGLIDKEDELLNIMLVHDLAHVDYLESVCSHKFNRVMGQVEGGIKVTVNAFNHKHDDKGTLQFYDLDMFHGKAIDGEKLCFANLESSIKDYVNATTPAEVKAQHSEGSDTHEAQDDEIEDDTHRINKSNIFIAIQPITTSTGESTRDSEGLSLIESNNPDSFSFTVILKDITNNITIISKTQPFPLKWVRWVSGDRQDIDAVFGTEEDSIDPSAWVKEWLKDGLALCFGVVAQEYVTKRMGI